MEALRMMSFRSAHDEAKFLRGWFSPSCEALLAAFAWYSLCAHFPVPGNSAAAKEQLMAHVANAHARVFSRAHDEHVKDALAWYLPEALSHATVHALREAFPKSSHQLDERLRLSLFESYVGWTSGFGGQTGRKVTSRRRAGSPRLADGLGGGLGGGGGGGGSGGSGSPRVPLGQLLTASLESGGAGEAGRGGSGTGGAAARGDRSFRQHAASARTAGAGVGGGGAPGAQGGAAGDGVAPSNSARRSMVVGMLPAVRRELVDVSACSPLMTRWLKMRQNGARGGTFFMESHRVRCSKAAEQQAQQDELIARGAPTFRDVRNDAATRSHFLVSDYSQKLHETLGQTANAKAYAGIQIAVLRREQERVLEKNTREYANYLCAVRRVMEENEEVKQ